MIETMRFIKSALEYRSIDDIRNIPLGLRGIYALYKKRGVAFDVVYIGMSGKNSSGSIKARILSHGRSIKKDWTHFSYYEMWDNVTDREIREIEGMFRQIYRFDSRANMHNTQLTHNPLIRLRRQTEKKLGFSRINKKSLGI
jgi:hypothetical protein